MNLECLPDTEKYFTFYSSKLKIFQLEKNSAIPAYKRVVGEIVLRD